ncbi:MAG: hypothetical protein HQK50_01410 [Oligoflexia bacterium]|nr:hypothetical protein [Oligoflexia bacterium]MBF0364195.1 hypothetical protein [Oligoflexia bacterium]
MKKLTTLLLLLLIAPLAATANTDESPFAFQGSATWFSNAYALGSAHNTQDISLLALPSLTTGKYTHAFKIEAAKTVSDQYAKWLISDGIYSIARPLWKKAELLKISASTKITLPLSVKSRHNTSLLMKVALTPSFKLSSFHSFFKSIELLYAPTLSKHFHKYRTSRSGNTNPSYALGNTISLVESPSDHLSFSLTFATTQAWNQDNKRLPPVYAFEQEVSYTFKNNANVALGHSQADNMYNGASESDLHLQLHDPYASTYYLSVSKTF